MTKSHSRHLRVIWQDAGDRRWVDAADRPWVVQSCTSYPHVWVDIIRFRQHGEADRYVAEINERDRILLEAER